MKILGLSAYYHDSAAALLDDGVIIAAAQEERFSRKKHDRAFPRAATRYCLQAACLQIDQIDRVVFFEQPLLKFQRVLATWLACAPQGGGGGFARSMQAWLARKLHLRRELGAQLQRMGRFDPARIRFTEHHLSHAASAFYPSPFEAAAILVADGVGEVATTSIWAGEGHRIEPRRQLDYPHSLGLLYAAFTAHLGFKVNSGEYKVMGLAPYGRPTEARKILDHLVQLKDDGSFRLDQRYFDYCVGGRMTSDRFAELFGPPRAPEGPLTARHFDLAASIQHAAEEVMLAITRAMAREDDTGNLCLSGGVALNCVANRKVLDGSGFKRLWVQPAAGDAGNALGAALVGHHLHAGRPRSLGDDGADAMQGAQLGPSFPQAECEARLRRAGAVFHVCDDAGLMQRCAALMAGGGVLGWFQGRMEFGPRALGNRSILADPRGVDMQRRLNLKIKYRESFRPFAPAVLAEDAAAWFELDAPSPYMLLVAPVRAEHRRACAEAAGAAPGTPALNLPRSSVPAVTHVDDSARVQTVDAQTHPRFHALISAFKAATGCPVLINTSFNVRGEPIVCTPEDAFGCFMATDLDALAVGNCLLLKSEQTARVARPAFEPD